MQYQTFGRCTGLRVSEFALGTANFGTAETSAGVEGSRLIFDAFTAAGGTTFDVSNVYQDGEAERLLGDMIATDRDDYVIITKYSGTRQTQPRPGTTGNSRKTMIRSVEASLRRLNTDYLDVFMPHFPDGVTPMDEILAGLDHLVSSGKILHGALSNFPAWRVAGAATAADLRGLSPIIGFQTEYSLAERSADRELLPMAEAHGLGALLYSPLAGGLLTGKYRRGETGRLSARGSDVEGTDHRANIVDAVLEVAEALDVSAVQVSLAWLRARAARSRTALVPIIGPRSMSHLHEYLLALDLDLDDEHFRRLDEVSAVRLGAPHDDVSAALLHGFDGDRSQLRPAAVPVR
jgi:aryl-alcohol dehydrogenase-like predicted oxidoreductase